MKSYISFIGIILLTYVLPLSAAVEFSGTAQTKTVNGVTITVYPEAKVDTGSEKLTVKLSGDGIRVKTVAFINVKVYAVASYVEDPTQFTEAQPMDGIRASRAKVLQLTMLRDMSGNDIRTAFEDALDLNGVDLNAAPIKAVLGHFNFAAKSGDVFTIAGINKANGDQQVDIGFPAKSVTEAGRDLANDFWKVWFGTPIDDGMRALQKSLIGK